MSNYNNKSSNNLSVASDLHTSNHFCQSVHCSYYATLQMMDHILLTKTNGIGALGIQNNQKNGQSSHNDKFSLFVLSFKKRMSKKDLNDINTEFFKIKNLRKKGDYSDKLVTQKESKNSLDSSNKICNILNTIK